MISLPDHTYYVISTIRKTTVSRSVGMLFPSLLPSGYHIRQPLKHKGKRAVSYIPGRGIALFRCYGFPLFFLLVSDLLRREGVIALIYRDWGEL